MKSNYLLKLEKLRIYFGPKRILFWKKEAIGLPFSFSPGFCSHRFKDLLFYRLNLLSFWRFFILFAIQSTDSYEAKNVC